MRTAATTEQTLHKRIVWAVEVKVKPFTVKKSSAAPAVATNAAQ
jgi:hypothetical protein